MGERVGAALDRRRDARDAERHRQGTPSAPLEIPDVPADLSALTAPLPQPKRPKPPRSGKPAAKSTAKTPAKARANAPAKSPAKVAAKKFKLSQGRVTQLRQRWCKEWLACQGEADAAGENGAGCRKEATAAS